MLEIELYIIFAIALFIVLGIIASYFSLNYFNLVIILFSLSTLGAAVFYTNTPFWSADEIESGIGSYIRGGLLLFSGTMGAVYFFRGARIHNFKVPLHLIILLAFIIFSVGSTFYSIDSRSTIIRSGLFFALCTFLFGLNYWLDSKEKFYRLMNILFYLVVIILVVNLLIMFVWPARSWWWKTPSRFLGILSHPNELGGFCLVAIPIILWKYYTTKGNSRFIILSFLLIGILILFSTGSRTSLIVTTLGLLIWLFLYKDWLKLSIIIILIAFSSIIIFEMGLPSFSRNEGAKITDLTEREEIWKGAITFAKQKPIIGYGYAVESKIFADQYSYDLEGTSLDINAQNPLHNGYISIFIGGGIIGLLIWLLAIFIPLFSVAVSKNILYKAYALATIIPILVANLVESSITGYLGFTDIYFWFAWIVAGKINIIEESADQSFTPDKKVGPNVR